jgi:hypothetical protein
MSLFGTPEQFGGGKAVAKPLFQKAVDLGKAEQAKPLYPHWGLEMSVPMLAAVIIIPHGANAANRETIFFSRSSLAPYDNLKKNF